MFRDKIKLGLLFSGWEGWNRQKLRIFIVAETLGRSKNIKSEYSNEIKIWFFTVRLSREKSKFSKNNSWNQHRKYLFSDRLNFVLTSISWSEYFSANIACPGLKIWLQVATASKQVNEKDLGKKFLAENKQMCSILVLFRA